MVFPLVAIVVAFVKRWLVSKGAAWTAAAIVYVFGNRALDSVIGWFSDNEPEIAAQLDAARHRHMPPLLTEGEKQQLATQHQAPDPAGTQSLFPMPAAPAATPAAAVPSCCCQPTCCQAPACTCLQDERLDDLVLDPYTEALIENERLDRLLSKECQCAP